MIVKYLTFMLMLLCCISGPRKSAPTDVSGPSSDWRSVSKRGICLITVAVDSAEGNNRIMHAHSRINGNEAHLSR
uniref:Putative secreted protein n=1 Tax=Anopheles darlingi TaxID=43151 RepID=A0A2M4DDC3_ANODA